MQVNGRTVKFSREDVLSALRMEMGCQEMQDGWPSDNWAELELIMNTRGGITLRIRRDGKAGAAKVAGKTRA